MAHAEDRDHPWYSTGEAWQFSDFRQLSRLVLAAFVRPAPIHCTATQKEQMKNIFVGNLSYDATEQAVRALFEEYGTVEKVSLITDRDTGRAKGFAFVEMSVNAEANQAIESLNGHDLGGRALNVNEARPREERGGFGGGGNRGGGFGRRRNRY